MWITCRQFVLLRICLCLTVVASFAAVHAGGIINVFTPQNIAAAMAGGGLVLFRVSGTNTVTTPYQIVADTTVDATGQKVLLSGGGASRIFVVKQGIKLTLVGISLAGGKGTNGGAIYSEGTVVATNCLFQGNSAKGTDGVSGYQGADDDGIGDRGGNGDSGLAALGGAIYSTGDVTLSQCSFMTNTARAGIGGNGGNGGDGEFQGGDGGDGGAGGFAFGGAIWSQGLVRVAACAFYANSVIGGDGGYGGTNGSGVFDSFPGHGGFGGDATGGAIYSAGRVEVVGSAFVTNSVAGGAGRLAGVEPSQAGRHGPRGGSAFGGAIACATLYLTNSTVYGSAAYGGDAGAGGSGRWIGGDGGPGGHALGGGLYVLDSGSIVFATLATNSVAGGLRGGAGDGLNPGEEGPDGWSQGSLIYSVNGSVDVNNTILSSVDDWPSLMGEVTDAGANLCSDYFLQLIHSSSRNGLDAKLTPLSNGGGATDTLGLLPESPAIDAGAVVAGVETDQRGIFRPQGAAPDIGAHEVAQTLVIGGRVYRGGAGYAGVPVVATRDGGVVLTATTDASGHYSITMPAVISVQVLVAQSGSGFTPDKYNLSASQVGTGPTNLDFLANPESLSIEKKSATNQVRILLKGIPQVTYRIQGSWDLAIWQTLLSKAADTNGLVEFIDSYPLISTNRSYRAVYP